jgi:steroid delta-isomerase
MNRRSVRTGGSGAANAARSARTTARKPSPSRAAAKRPQSSRGARAGLTGPQMVELVARYVSAFNRGDVEALLSFYHPRATMEDPVGYTPASGHGAIRAVYAGGFRQGVTIALDGAVCAATGAVAFPVEARTATAKLWSVNVFDLSEDGLILRMRAYWGPSNVEGEISVRG